MVANLFVAKPARDISFGVVQYLYAKIDFNTLNVGTADTVWIGTLPAGAQILNAIVRVTTVFNAATTNVLTVGIAGTNNNIVAAGDVNEAAAATTIVVTGADLEFAVDTPIYARYTQSGTAATTGSAKITIPFIATGNG